MRHESDAVIIGAGFFGLRIALFLRETLGLERVTVLEAEATAMTRASYVNQARVHNGYHYPRSILTAYRSRASSQRWSEEYAPAIYGGFRHYYAIASRLSKVNARQFEVFCERIGAPLKAPPPETERWFSPSYIEKVWEVEEYAFDSRRLRDLVLERIRRVDGVRIEYGARVTKIQRSGSKIVISTEAEDTYESPVTISSVYAATNELHRPNGLPLVPLQLEITEMALVRMPDALRDVAVTVMDGPFFSAMPFPSRGLHTLSHVRYTPHSRWRDTTEQPDARRIARPEEMADGRSSFPSMIADVQRYLPMLRDVAHIDSIKEVKAVLAQYDVSDSRPILVRSDSGMDGYFYVLGGKIDNVNDVLDELGHALAERGHTHRLRTSA